MMYYTICDGQCEAKMISYLKLNNYRFGITYVKTLCDINPDKLLRLYHQFDRQSIVTLVFDTDNLRDEQLEKLIKNIRLLAARVKRVRVITQDRNFEDELSKGLLVGTPANLTHFFNAAGIEDFKSKFIGLKSKVLDDKMKSLNHQVFWSSLVLGRLTSDIKLLGLNKKLCDIR